MSESETSPRERVYYAALDALREGVAAGDLITAVKEAIWVERQSLLLPAKPDKQKSSSGLPPAQAFAEGQKILKERQK
jgi:hypothetical protein